MPDDGKVNVTMLGGPLDGLVYKCIPLTRGGTIVFPGHGEDGGDAVYIRNEINTATYSTFGNEAA